MLADENLPDRGDEVVIKVQVEYQSIPIGEQDLGQLYVVELEQLERQTNLPQKQ